MRGEPNSAMILNTKRCREEDRVTKKDATKYLGTVASCHSGYSAKGDIVAKMKLRRKRRELEKNRTHVLIFLNVASTSVFNTKLMLTKQCKP